MKHERPNLDDGWILFTEDSIVNIGDETYWTHDEHPNDLVSDFYGTGVVTQEAIDEGVRKNTTGKLWAHWDNGIGYMYPWDGSKTSAKVYYRPQAIGYTPTQEGDREDDI
jgi:hypothetical protein